MKLTKYRSYQDYVKHQKEKTLSIERRKKEARDFDRKCEDFMAMVARYIEQFDIPRGTAVCVGSRAGAEVKALQQLGFDAIGYDLVAHEPWTLEGDMHELPVESGVADLVFTNAFDHAADPFRAAGELQRISKPGGFIIAQLAIGKSGDKYKANELARFEEFTSMLPAIEVLSTKGLSGPGRGSINFEVVLKL